MNFCHLLLCTQLMNEIYVKDTVCKIALYNVDVYFKLTQ